MRTEFRPTFCLSFLMAVSWSLTRRRGQAASPESVGVLSIAPSAASKNLVTRSVPTVADMASGYLDSPAESTAIIAVQVDAVGAVTLSEIGPCGRCGRNRRPCMGTVSPDGTWETLFCRTCVSAARRAAALGAPPPPPLLALRGRCAACPRRATFGPRPGRAIHCKRHRLPGEQDAANRRCRAPGCPRQPAYGDPASGAPLFCAAHRAENHTNLKRRLCQHPEVLPASPSDQCRPFLAC